jgi:hypothetical protein
MKKNAEQATKKAEEVIEEVVEETTDDKAVETVTVKKEAIKSARGKTTTDRTTIRKAKVNQKKQNELKKPTSNQVQTFKVLSRLKKDGEVYEEGDTFQAKPCAQIDVLIEDGVIK